MKRFVWYVVFPLASIALMTASLTHRISNDWTEVIGFITGAACVWLVVEEHIWNWPIGIASSVFFVIVFARGRLWSDMGLQVVYVILGFLGWYNWLYGGAMRTELKVRRAPTWEWALLAGAGIAGTILLRWINLKFNGAAPFWDALTTSFSLVAQYMITRKYLENWLVWIAVDLIYVPLYFSRHLQLTGLLYIVFTIMAYLGWRQWNRSLQSQEEAALAAPRSVSGS